MRLAALVVGVGSVLALCAAPRAAWAFEREWHLGAGVGISNGAGLKPSPALGAYASYGISDAFDLRAELTARGYQLGAKENPNALAGMLGVAYKLDVLRWVPWAGVYAGYVRFLEPPRSGLNFKQGDMALGFGGGLDYAFTRKFGLGASVRFDDALGSPGASSFDALLRAEYRWGW